MSRSRKTTKRVAKPKARKSTRKPVSRKAGKDATKMTTPETVTEALTTAAEEKVATEVDAATVVPTPPPVTDIPVPVEPAQVADVHPDQLPLPDPEPVVVIVAPSHAEMVGGKELPSTSVLMVDPGEVKTETHTLARGRKPTAEGVVKLVAKRNARIAKYAKWVVDSDGLPCLTLSVPLKGPMFVRVRLPKKHALRSEAGVAAQSQVYEVRLLEVGPHTKGKRIGLPVLIAIGS